MTQGRDGKLSGKLGTHGKRGEKPCIRGLRITVYVLREFPYLTEEDIRACLAYAADRERKQKIWRA
ncbi:MAG: hypothetical protein DMG76_23070 [Acidobacteria bacterium]|nr:MAG: hypothetical protein DMG76_23070 [Acidobacteriota bacterium]